MNIKTNIKNSFELARVEIYKLPDFDIVTASPTGPGAFEGEEELFPTSWREYNGE